MHRTSLKLLHFAPFLDSRLTSGDRVASVSPVANEEQEQYQEGTVSSINVIPDEYKESTVFQLGFMAFRLLTGKCEKQAKTPGEYEAMVRDIRETGERMLEKATKDGKLTAFVMKMLSSNPSLVPSFQQVLNFFKYRTSQLSKKLANKELKIDIEL